MFIIADGVFHNKVSNGLKYSITVDRLVKLTCLSKPTIVKTLKDLVERGLLSVVEKGKKGLATTYTVDLTWFDDYSRSFLQFIKENGMFEALLSNSLTNQDISILVSKFNKTEQDIKNNLTTIKSKYGK